MTQVYDPPHAFRPLAFGAVGGAVAAALALALLVLLTVAQGGVAPTVPNAVGAWLVRWLQTAEPSALDGVYIDATLGGGAVFLFVGALLGALFAALLERLPEDHPLVWGVALGVGLWLLTRWAVAPSLDPILTRAVPSAALLAVDLVFSLLLGGWVQAGRRVRQHP